MKPFILVRKAISTSLSRIITIAKLFPPFFIFLFLFSATGINIFAATKTFTGTGNFSDPARWNGGTLPAPGDNLVINGACTVDNNAVTDNVVYGTLTIGSTAARTLSWVAGGTNRLNVSNVSASFAGSSLNMTNGGVLIIGGTWTSTNLSFTPGAGTIEIRAAITLPAAYTTYNNLTVNAAVTVSIGVNTTINSNLTITTGTLSVGAFSLNVTGTASVTGTFTITNATGAKSFGHLTINSGGTFNNTTANVPITIGGNFENNGTFNQGTGRVTFTGAASNMVTGTAASTGFGGGITINKGTSYSNVLDVQAVITMINGGLTLTNGTFKLSSASTITPFTVNISTPPFLIPATTGLWCNGGTIQSVNMTWALGGLLRVSAGTLNQGFAVDNVLSPKDGSEIIMDGGNFNVASRISFGGGSWSFTMTGGTLTLNTVGSTGGASGHIFNMDMPGCSLSMSGGTMIIRRSGGTNGGFNNLATLGSGFTGGTLQLGDALTPAGQTINVYSVSAIDNLAINNANVTVRLITGALTVTNSIMIYSGILNANNFDITVGDNWTNNASTTAFVAGSGTVYMTGINSGAINGTLSTTFNNLTINCPSRNVTCSVNNIVTGDLLISAGLLNLSSYTLNRSTSGGTLTLLNGAILWIGGTNTFPSSYATHSIGATSFIEYTGSNQSVAVLNSSQDYGHLRISGTATKTLAGAITVRGNLTIAASTLNTNNFNLTVNGNFTNMATGIFVNNAIFTAKGNITNDQPSMVAGTGTTILNGTSTQFINGSQPFKTFNLTTNNAAGVTLNNNLSVAGVHTFTAGDVNTSATPNYLIYEAGSSYTGEADNRHVNGWVKKIGNINFSFPVGNGTVIRKAS